jgi:hypothetical protein
MQRMDKWIIPSVCKNLLQIKKKDAHEPVNKRWDTDMSWHFTDKEIWMGLKQ